MPSKKHPLEIFKKHGSFSALPGKTATRAPSTDRNRTGRRKEKDPAQGAGRSVTTGVGDPQQRRSGRAFVPPGDRRISLSLNLVLVLLLFMVALSLFTYFLGYNKGLSERTTVNREAALKSEMGGRFLSPEGNVSQPTARDSVTKESPPLERTFYGVQVGVWAKKKRALAEEAARWLFKRYGKKGLDFKVSPLADTDYVTIIAGSFSSGEDPELERLLDSIQKVDDYPSGGPAPFRSAKIVSYSLAGEGS